MSRAYTLLSSFASYRPRRGPSQLSRRRTGLKSRNSARSTCWSAPPATRGELRPRAFRSRESWRHSGCLLCKAQQDEDGGPSQPLLSKNQLVVAAGGFALVLAALITANREDIADAFLGDGVSTGVSSWGGGDVLGGSLWSVALYFASPWQLLLIFLGRVDTERPSDWLLDKLGRALGNDVTKAEYSHPLYLRAAAIVFFATCGTLVAWGFSAALGDATWSVSTGLGSCFAAAIYEVGRPDRLSSDEAKKLEAQYADFAIFADDRLQPRGGCHESEIFAAFRQSNSRYRSEESLSDATLRQFIRNWAKQYIYPTAERTSNGYFKKISLRERIDPFTGSRTGLATAGSASSASDDS